MFEMSVSNVNVVCSCCVKIIDNLGKKVLRLESVRVWVLYLDKLIELLRVMCVVSCLLI